MDSTRFFSLLCVLCDNTVHLDFDVNKPVTTLNYHSFNGSNFIYLFAHAVVFSSGSSFFSDVLKMALSFPSESNVLLNRNVALVDLTLRIIPSSLQKRYVSIYCNPLTHESFCIDPIRVFSSYQCGIYSSSQTV